MKRFRRHGDCRAHSLQNPFVTNRGTRARDTILLHLSRSRSRHARRWSSVLARREIDLINTRSVSGELRKNTDCWPVIVGTNICPESINSVGVSRRTSSTTIMGIAEGSAGRVAGEAGRGGGNSLHTNTVWRPSIRAAGSSEP